MSKDTVKLVCQMVLNSMGGRKERTWDLYEEYLRETRFYITVKEYIEWRKEQIAC